MQAGLARRPGPRHGRGRAAARPRARARVGRRPSRMELPGRRPCRSRSPRSTAAATPSARLPRHPRDLRRRAAWRRWTRSSTSSRTPTRTPTRSRDEIEGVIEDLPTVTVKDPEGFADGAAEPDQPVPQPSSTACSGSSVVIAVLGVVNTLSLSVIERTREVGLLRAVGVSRRQLRTMIRLEAVVIAVFGAVLGVAMGVAFGVGAGPGAARRGAHRPRHPVGRRSRPSWSAAGLLGVLAAVFPARRAARLDVLRRRSRPSSGRLGVSVAHSDAASYARWARCRPSVPCQAPRTGLG